MAYRGQDLDLRVGRTSTFRGMTGLPEGGAGTEAATSRFATRDGTISVDETLMATCNHAYEAAVFHGSREVRLEHLVYALARVGAAAHILDDLGIRPERLRREAALAIAAETPATAADAKNEPVTSEEFEKVLRQASERAADRGALAGVPDLLRTILSAGRDNATVSLLSRSSSDPQRLERWREESLRREREPSVTELLRASHGAPDQTPTILARIDQLDHELRAATMEAGSDRRHLQDSLRQVQDALHALTSTRHTPMLQDRTDEIKTLLDQRLHDVSELVLSLDDRLHAAGQQKPGTAAIEDVRAHFERLEQRVMEQGEGLSRALTPALSERLSKMISERIGDAPGQVLPGDLAPKIAQLESTVREHLAKDTGSDVAGKVGQLDTALRAHLQGAEELSKTHERDLSEIYEALVKLGANQQTLANNLNTWRLDTSGDVSIVSNRLEALETTVLESLGRISAELQMLRGAGVLEEPEHNTTGWSFKRWLFGTSKVLSPNWHRSGPGPVRHALTRLRLVRKT